MANKPTSLQSIFDADLDDMFIGRGSEVAGFVQNLELPAEDVRRKFIYSVVGQGGVGKSTLLSHFRQLATSSGSFTALVDDRASDVPSLLWEVGEQFKAQGCTLRDFSEKCKLYRDWRQTLETHADAPQGFSTLVAALAKTGIGLAKLTPAGPFIEPIAGCLDAETLGKQTAEFYAHIARNIKDKEEAQLIREPIKILSKLFVADLWKAAEKQPLAFFFDAFEETCEYLDDWLLDLMRSRYGSVPSALVLAIAGRNGFKNTHWQRYKRRIESIQLQPFTKAEVREYLALDGIVDESEVKSIFRVSNGLPLIVAWLSAQGPAEDMSTLDPSNTAVECFLAGVKEAEQRRIALLGALPLHLDVDTLAVVMGSDDIQEVGRLYDWLATRNFVEMRTEGLMYHEVVRAQILAHQRHHSKSQWIAQHKKLEEYFQAQLESLNLTNRMGLSNSIWQSYEIQRSYHSLCSDLALPDQVLELVQDFIGLLGYDAYFARTWATTIYKAGNDSDCPPVIRLAKRLTDGMKGYLAGNFEAALQMIDHLIRQYHLSDSARCSALCWRARQFSMLDRNQDSINDLTEAIALDPEAAYLYDDRGHAYGEMGAWEQAVVDYSQSLSLADYDPWTWAQRGRAHHALGNFEQAEHDFDRAVKLLGAHSREAAHWHAHLGMLLDDESKFEDALRSFNSALSANPEETTALAYRAELLGKLGDFDSALRDIERGLQLEKEKTLGYSKRSEIFLQMGKYQDVLDDVKSTRASSKGHLIGPVERDLAMKSGVALTALGRYQEAYVTYTSLSGASKNPVLLYNIAVLIAYWKGLDDAQDAIDAARDALTSGEYSDSKAFVQYCSAGLAALEGRNDDALRMFQQALSRSLEAVSWQRSDMAWNQLRASEAFQAIVDGATQKAKQIIIAANAALA